MSLPTPAKIPMRWELKIDKKEAGLGLQGLKREIPWSHVVEEGIRACRCLTLPDVWLPTREVDGKRYFHYSGLEVSGYAFGYSGTIGTNNQHFFVPCKGQLRLKVNTFENLTPNGVLCLEFEATEQETDGAPSELPFSAEDQKNVEQNILSRAQFAVSLCVVLSP